MATVALIVVEDASEHIRAVGGRMHIWALDTATNRAVAESLRNDHLRDGGKLVITLFRDSRASPEDHVAHQLDTMDLHHGPYSQDPGWMRVEVYGARLTEPLRREFTHLGCDRFEENSSGFIAIRPEATRP